MNQEHIYHIYPLGYVGANQDYNDGKMVQSITEVNDLIPHLKSLEVSTVLFGPIFEAQTHGYDTIDYSKVDRRLGSNEDFRKLVHRLHDSGIKVILDCVFNHVSRDHFTFKDLKAHREQSSYKDWFMNVNFNNNNGHNDHFSYGCWDGHENLVKLNLDNPSVQHYLIETARMWVETFNIDGLRMDAADVMSLDFLRALSDTMHGLKSGFMMLGEVVHGNYNRWLQEGGLDLITNYETYKGLYSSLNDQNYYEVAYALQRQFGKGGVYPKESMLNFVDNHDVNRVASQLKNQGHLYPLYIMLYTMPGIPSLYYGSEYGYAAVKGQGTAAPLRPSWNHISKSENHPIAKMIKKLAGIRKSSDALREGTYEQCLISAETIGYKRTYHQEVAYVLINAKEQGVSVMLPELKGTYIDILNNETIQCNGGTHLYQHWARILVKK
jgi:tRNA(adenine34) deaminase